MINKIQLREIWSDIGVHKFPIRAEMRMKNDNLIFEYGQGEKKKYELGLEKEFEVTLDKYITNTIQIKKENMQVA